MNKLNKIFLAIIIILVILLGIITAMYLNMRKAAKKSLDEVLKISEEKYELNNQLNDLREHFNIE